MNVIFLVLICLLGIVSGSFFNRIGNVFSNNKNYKYNVCKNCKHEIGYFHISCFSYIRYLGKCKFCKSKISLFPVIVEITTAFLYALCYLKFYKDDPSILNIIYALTFVSALIVIFVSDVDYMLIPDKVLVMFGITIVILKIAIGYYNESYENIIDVGYEIIFMLYDGFFMFMVMYLIKKLGDFLLKKDSMGGGDIKLMFFISMVLGWKLSIIVIFLAAFLALPLSIINMLTKKSVMLPFGPYLALSSIILFLSKIDFNTLIDYIL